MTTSPLQFEKLKTGTDFLGKKMTSLSFAIRVAILQTRKWSSGRASGWPTQRIRGRASICLHLGLTVLFPPQSTPTTDIQFLVSQPRNAMLFNVETRRPPDWRFNSVFLVGKHPSSQPPTSAQSVLHCSLLTSLETTEEKRRNFTPFMGSPSLRTEPDTLQPATMRGLAALALELVTRTVVLAYRRRGLYLPKQQTLTEC